MLIKYVSQCNQHVDNSSYINNILDKINFENFSLAALSC